MAIFGYDIINSMQLRVASFNAVCLTDWPILQLELSHPVCKTTTYIRSERETSSHPFTILFSMSKHYTFALRMTRVSS